MTLKIPNCANYMHHANKVKSVCVCVCEIELIQTGNKIYFRITNFLGQSGSGKTSMVQKLLETNFFKEKPVKVMVCIPKNMERFLEESTDDYKKSWNNIEIFEGRLRGVVRMG